ncbi:hypothetical protein [Sphingomonas immobilis]|uniref:Uncharacterized protein n=1 Tax=Sphingomonas immobilis TaxID=3063997 RepID=A0ABT9A479_9SPHN|nr:hypothetical protein [Sphingomonas sp. CA1-15]MDO7843771.1 hypothetical protein [Sphingomonas sp. CA1-15]
MTNWPEPKDKFSKGLWSCTTIEEVGQLHGLWFKAFNGKAINSVAKRKISKETRTTLKALLQQVGATSSPTLIGERSCNTAWEMLHVHLCNIVTRDPSVEVALVTFISGDGATSHYKTEIDLFTSQQTVQKTLRAMSPNWFGVTELALFNSQGFPGGGQLVQRHEHALIFGKGVIARAKVVAARHESRYSSNSTGAPVIDIKAVTTDEVNLARISAYLFKPPYKCMNWNPGKDGKRGHMNGSEKSDRLIRYLRLAQYRCMMDFEQTTFGGGEGLRIRSSIIAFLRALAVKDADAGRRVLHPDAVATFWVDLTKELGAPWNLPIIKTRP